MGLKDVYEVWDAYEYDQVDMMYSILRSTEDSLVPILGTLSENIDEGLENASGFLETLNTTLKNDWGSLFTSLWHDIDIGVTTILKPIWEAIKYVGEELKPAYEYIGRAITGATEVIATELGWIIVEIGDILAETASDLWVIVKDISVWVYDAISKALKDCWDYFIDTVIPFIYQMLVRVYESPEVQKVIAYLTEQLKALFDWLFTIDTAEMEKWAKKTAEFVKALVESEGA